MRGLKLIILTISFSCVALGAEVMPPIEFKLKKNPFEDYFKTKFVEKLKEEVKMEVKREAGDKRKQVLKNLLMGIGGAPVPPQISPPTRRELNVQAILCEGRNCYAITDEGVFRDGDTFDGGRVKIEGDRVYVFFKKQKHQ